MKKYEFTGVTKSWTKGKTLHQIRALRDFGTVHAGDIGGFIEKEDNLSHDGNAWVMRNAVVYGDAAVYGDALITGNAMVCGDARIYGSAAVGGRAIVNGNAWICNHARIIKSADYISVSGLNARNNITAFMDLDGEIVIVAGDYKGDIITFLNGLTGEYGNGKTVAEAFELTEIIKLHFGKR